MWFAEWFFKLMQIQMMMNDIRFQTSPKETEEALEDRNTFEKRIRVFTRFKKPDLISQQIAEAPKVGVPVLDKLRTLAKAETKAAEAKRIPKHKNSHRVEQKQRNLVESKKTISR